MPERSFFWHGYQFPICARCTGVMIGQLLAVLLYWSIKVPAIILILFCGILFGDWFLQYVGIRESNNQRRLFTGVLGGYALTTTYFLIGEFILVQL